MNEKKIGRRKLLVIGGLSRIVVFCTAILSNIVWGIRSAPGLWDLDIAFFNLFARWDSGYYLEIARFGYDGRHWAFFPLYPLVIRIVSLPFAIFLSIENAMAVAGFLTSNFCFFLLIIYFHKLTLTLFRSRRMTMSAPFLCIFPSSIFFSVVYSEALFMFLTMASLYYMETSKWEKATIPAVLSGLTRPVGFLISIPLWYKAWVEVKGGRRKFIFICPILTLCTYPIFMCYGYLMTGNLFIHHRAQAYFRRSMVPFISITGLPVYISLGLVLPIVVLSFFSILDFFRFKENWLRFTSRGEIIPYYFHASALLFVYLFLADPNSFARFALTLLPVYWFLSKMSADVRSKALVSFGCLLLLTISTSLFVNWYEYR